MNACMSAVYKREQFVFFLCTFSFRITFRHCLLTIIHPYTLVLQSCFVYGDVLICILWAIRPVHEGCRHSGQFIDRRRKIQGKWAVTFRVERSQWSDLWWTEWAGFSTDGINIYVSRGLTDHLSLVRDGPMFRTSVLWWFSSFETLSVSGFKFSIFLVCGAVVMSWKFYLFKSMLYFPHDSENYERSCDPGNQVPPDRKATSCLPRTCS